MLLAEASTKGPSMIKRILAATAGRASATYRRIGVRQFTLISRAWIIQEFNSSGGATVCAIRRDGHLCRDRVHLPKRRQSLHNLARWFFNQRTINELVPASWNRRYHLPCAMVRRKLIIENIMKTNIRMSEHLMRQSSELLVLQLQLIKRDNLA